MKVFKLTNQRHRTHNGCQWGEGVRHTTSGEGDLYGPGWLHFYSSAEVAIFMNPAFGNIPKPVLWLSEARGKIKDDRGFKAGCTDLKTLRIIEAPKITLHQRVRAAIHCVQEIGYDDKEWCVWADRWLSGEDRGMAGAFAVSNASVIDVHKLGNVVNYADVRNAFYAARTASAAAAHNTSFAVSNVAAYAAYAASYAKEVKEFDLRETILKAIRKEKK